MFFCCKHRICINFLQRLSEGFQAFQKLVLPSLTHKCSFFRGLRCIARFEYIGDHKDELSFSEGEIITLQEHVNDEWARGELGNRTGIFPLNFVEFLEEYPTSSANILSEYKELHHLLIHMNQVIMFALHAYLITTF